MTRLLFIWSIFSFLKLNAQVQWASELVSFSNEFSRTVCSAKEVLGKPSSIPEKGFTYCAWSPSKPDDEMDDFIDVRFDVPQEVQQIFIVESVNPGAIFEVYLYSTEGRKFRVFQQVPKPVLPLDKEGRLFNIKIPRTPYLVNRLRIVLISRNVPGYNLIDAIGISSDTSEYKIEIEQIADVGNFAEPENLGSKVNSYAAELAPQISADGKFLFFTRQNHSENIGDQSTQDIWFSEIDSNQQFSLSKNIGEPVNNAFNNALCAVSPGAQSLLLLNKYLPDGKGEYGISMTTRTDSGWSFPISLELEEFYNLAASGEFNMGSDGNTLLLTAKRRDAIGEKDIYVSFKKEDGTWSVPQNLGPEINTAENETSPFLASDGETVYFSTKGYPGYGGMDIFVSRRLDNSWTRWSKPLNLGPRLNTNGYDAYFSIPASGEYAYFSSSKNSLGLSDIMRVKMPEAAKPKPVVLIRGKVINARTNKPVEANILFGSLLDSLNKGIAKSDPKTGDYNIILTAGVSYGYLAQKAGFLSLSEHIDLDKIETYKEINVDLKLTPIEIGAVIRLNNLFFDSNMFDLKYEDEKELKRIYELMLLYPNMQIEVSGHTDNLGTDQSNLTLSINRAKSVAEYLYNKGIQKDRVVYLGKGKNSPLTENNTEKGRALNRRIEMKLLKID